MALGKEINNFVKMFLATSKMGWDRDYRERRLALEEKKAAGMSPEQWEQFLSRFGVGGNRSGGASGSGTSSSGGGTPRTTEQQRVAAQERMNYLINEKGADPKVAAAIVGNTWHEGAGFQTTVRGDNGNSFGEFQFNNKGEMPPFQAWAQRNNRDINDWKSQYDFVWDARLNGPYKNVLERMQAAPDQRSAAEIFMRGYERPSIPHLGSRQSYADQALGLFGKGKKASAAAESNDNVLGPTQEPSAGAVPLPPRRPDNLTPQKNAEAETALPMEPQNTAEVAPEAEKPMEFAQAEPAQTALPMEEETTFAARGGMIEAQNDQALRAALFEVQNSMGSQQAALPDGNRGQRMASLQKGEGAISPDAYDALRKSVDPDGMNPNATRDAMNKIYGFYVAKGDKAAASKVAAGVLQAARNRSMEFGQMAGDALEKKNYPLAARALAAAYNEVPDGKRVTAEVNEQGVGRATVMDANTDKVVEQMELNPRTLGVATMQFMGGNEFYAHLASSLGRAPERGIGNG